MNYSKMGVVGGSALGVLVAAAALSGCTPSAQTSASGGAGTTSAAASATTTTSTAAEPTTSASTVAGTPTCTDADLKVTANGAGAGAGHVAWILVFTNTGSAACTVEGYPGAGVTDKPGDVVLNATRQRIGYIGGQYPSPATIVLKPGDAASTVLEWLDAPLNGQAPAGANCPGMDGGKVLVTPPNTRQSTSFSAPPDLCADFEVHPLVAGTSGRAA